MSWLPRSQEGFEAERMEWFEQVRRRLVAMEGSSEEEGEDEDEEEVPSPPFDPTDFWCPGDSRLETDASFNTGPELLKTDASLSIGPEQLKTDASLNMDASSPQKKLKVLHAGSPTTPSDVSCCTNTPSAKSEATPTTASKQARFLAGTSSWDGLQHRSPLPDSSSMERSPSPDIELERTSEEELERIKASELDQGQIKEEELRTMHADYIFAAQILEEQYSDP